MCGPILVIVTIAAAVLAWRELWAEAERVYRDSEGEE